MRATHRRPLPLRLALLAVWMAVPVLAGCPLGRQLGANIAECGAQVVRDEVASVLGRTVKAVQGTDAMWADEITRLELNGVAFAICAVQAAFSTLAKSIPPHAAPSGAVKLGRDRARVYLAAHGVPTP